MLSPMHLLCCCALGNQRGSEKTRIFRFFPPLPPPCSQPLAVAHLAFEPSRLFTSERSRCSLELTCSTGQRQMSKQSQVIPTDETLDAVLYFGRSSNSCPPALPSQDGSLKVWEGRLQPKKLIPH